MAIQSTTTSAETTADGKTQLGEVSISDSYQDAYLPLILNELRRISLLLAEMSMQQIDLNEVIEVQGDH